MGLETNDASGTLMVAQFWDLTLPSMEKLTEQRQWQALKISKGTVNILMLSFTAQVTFI